MALSDINLEKLDKRLQELAGRNFNEFCIVTGIDKLQVFICLERKDGMSYGQIARFTGISRDSVIKKCKKCQ